MNLRPYQTECYDAVIAAWRTTPRTLVVMPTGTGKTVVFAHLAKWGVTNGYRVLVLVHREILVTQAADKIHRVTGIDPAVEQGQHTATGGVFRPPIVVASKDSLHERRLKRYEVDRPWIVIVDEAHLSVAKSFTAPIFHFAEAHPNTLVCGFTATPMRLDNLSLANVYQEVAYDYRLPAAVRDGWLVPVRTTMTYCVGMDFSGVSKVGGDLNQGQVAAIMEQERPLHEVADGLFRYSAGRKTLAFFVRVEQAQMTADILNRHQAHCAVAVHAGTPQAERDSVLESFRDGRIQILCNVGLYTTGFDEPGVEVLGMARPTTSVALYMQMLGRGTRPLDGVVDAVPIEEGSDGRKAAIASSPKPFVEVLDFVGNAGRHDIVTAIDALAGDTDADVRAAARELASSGRTAADIEELVAEATANKAAAAAREEAERQAALASRRAIVGRGEYVTRTIDPLERFTALGHAVMASAAAMGDGPATPDQVAFLQTRANIAAAGLTAAAAQRLIEGHKLRMSRGLCSIKMARKLHSYGYDPNMPMDRAKRIIAALARNNWRALPRETAHALGAYSQQPSESEAVLAGRA